MPGRRSFPEFIARRLSAKRLCAAAGERVGKFIARPGGERIVKMAKRIDGEDCGENLCAAEKRNTQDDGEEK